MNALELFKQAGILDQIKASLGGAGNAGETFGRYARNGLLGAGVGATGMGLASMMGGEDNESPSDRRSRILTNILSGGALGGAAGLGGTAFHDQFLKDKVPSNIQAYADALKKRTGQTLDTTPRSNNHPLEAAAIGATGQHPAVDAGVGAAGGMGFNWLKNRSANSLYDKLKSGPFSDVGPDNNKLKPDIIQRAQQMANNSVEHDPIMKSKLLEKLVSSTGGKAGVGDISAMGDSMGLPAAQVLEQAPNLHRISQGFNGAYKAAPGAFTQQFPRLGGALNGLKENVVNTAGKSGISPFALKNMRDYGKAGLKGSLLGLVLSAGGKAVVDGQQKLRYPYEQLRAWNEMQ